MGRKTFYTQRDIEDLIAQGTTSLTLGDDIVLTDVARERASELGLSLLDDPPANLPSPDLEVLSARIKATVLARMGSGISEALLDAIIPKILAEIQARQLPRQR
jgi:hypothetical protein